MMYVLGLVGRVFFLFELYGDHRDLPGLTHSFPAGRSSDLLHEGRNDLRAIGRMVDDDIARTNEIGDNAQVLLTEAGDRIGAIARRTNEVLAKERSEEHTSELQSLMRISYAVFCLKKQTSRC